MKYRVAADVGGTFTDIVLLAEDGRFATSKISSTPSQFERAVIDGIDRMLEPVLPLTDLFLPNRDESEIITGLTSPVDQARRFHAQGAGCAVVTCGGQGVVLADASGVVRAPAYPVEQVDATGGGDAFVAGFLYGRLHGRSTDDCLKLGSALGASCVQAPGATTGVFRAAELEAFVASHPLAVSPAP